MSKPRQIGIGEAAPVTWDIIDRIVVKLDMSGECWEFVGYRKPDGYGRIKARGQSRAAHRVAYELAVGPIPDGFDLDHLCRNRACCNPDHLEPVTTRVNVLRGISPGAKNAQKTQCPQGHPYDDANTRWSGNERRCVICTRKRSREAMRRRRARERAEQSPC